MFEFVFIFDCMQDRIVRSWICTARPSLDSSREPNFSGSESDMYTVHARSKIYPCVTPRTPFILYPLSMMVQYDAFDDYIH